MELKVHSINPLVGTIDEFITAETAQEIIELGKGKLTPTLVASSQGANVQDDRCTSYQTHLDQWSNETLTKLVVDVSEVLRLPPENCEPCKLLHYEGSQKFVPHLDAFAKHQGGMEQLAKGGQRIFSAMIYLNDVDGGETTFPALKINIKPKLGRFMVFENTRIGTIDAHPHAIHGGMPVNSGEKWALHFGWRQLAFHVQRDFPENTGPEISI